MREQEVAVGRRGVASRPRPSWPMVALAASLALGASPAQAQFPYEVLQGFEDPPSNPYAALIRGADGALYGTTLSGGTSGSGTIFKINEDGTAFSKIHDFDNANGGFPYAALIRGAHGALYGTTFQGGPGGGGVVFRVPMATTFPRPTTAR